MASKATITRHSPLALQNIMSQQTIPNDVFITGNLSTKTMTIPNATVTDATIASNAGVQATKLIHQYQVVHADPSATAASTYKKTIYVVHGANATLVAFVAGCVTPCIGSDTITVKLRKNGTDILTADISLTNAQSAYQLVTAAGFTSTTAVAGDVFEIDITANHSSGTLGAGLFAELVLTETPV